MTWHLTRDLDVFEASAGAFVRSDTAANTMFVSMTAVLRRRGLDAFGPVPPSLGWYAGENGPVEGVFVQAPPVPMQLSAVPEHMARELADLLAHGDTAAAALSGASGSVASVDAFTARWCELTGAKASIHMRQRLYRLGTLTPPVPAPVGAPRLAAASDREVLVAWFEAFGTEIGEPPMDVSRLVDDRIGYGGIMLWEVEGTAVSMAGVTRVMQDSARVAPVYTPKDLRGRGFAGAVTAAVSGAAQEAGARVLLLFTDLANPTSNALYQRIGYEPVTDLVVYRFND
jgi:GNAT superfamily N-acetyltransferase